MYSVQQILASALALSIYLAGANGVRPVGNW
jgi:hypothetical protein